MSLYHETAEVLRTLDTAPGSLKNRIFKKTDLKSPPAQVYALAIETAKWSEVLKEVIDSTELLKAERKLTPILALLLVHDLLLSRGGISLPASHGLVTSVTRHKARLSSTLTRIRIRKRCATIDALRQQVEVASKSEDAGYPRWIRVNTILSDVTTELETTFKNYRQVGSVAEVMEAGPGEAIHIDEHIPNLLAASPGTDVTRTEAYKKGKIILQDKASCFPAYLLDARPEDGDVIDGCAAPGNKTTHAAAILSERNAALGPDVKKRMVYAYEKSKPRSQILTKMVGIAGAKDIVKINSGHDFLRTDPEAMGFVGSLLLDPSCSGSGIVGRDSNPTLYIPEGVQAQGKKSLPKDKVARKLALQEKKKEQEEREKAKEAEVHGKKRKRSSEAEEAATTTTDRTLLDDDGNEIFTASSAQELDARLRALAAFQYKIVLHSLEFSGARRVTYSTCSVHAEENERVVMDVLKSDVARRRGWRILRRDEQVEGMKKWPVRGVPDMADGNLEVAEGCIRSYKGDGKGVMGFFVAGFVRDDELAGQYVPVEKPKLEVSTESEAKADGDSESEDSSDSESESDNDSWGGFDD